MCDGALFTQDKLFKLFKQSSPRDSQFLRGERKSVCRDVVYLVGRRVLRARERGVSNTLLGDQRVRGRRDRIGLDSAVVAASFGAAVAPSEDGDTPRCSSLREPRGIDTPTSVLTALAALAVPPLDMRLPASSASPVLFLLLHAHRLALERCQPGARLTRHAHLQFVDVDAQNAS